MNRPVGTVTPPKVSTVRKSRFSFSNKQAQNLGDSMLDHYAELSKNISLIDTNSNFVDIDYIVNLVHDLDFEGLLYLRNVVEELIKK